VTTKDKNIIISILLAIVILFAFILGYGSGKRNNIPVEVHDTIWTFDTVEHHIIDTFPFFIVKRDTIVFRDTIPADIDTSEIIKQYLAIHYYSREWRDSSVIITVDDAVSENRLIDQSLKYEITRPQSIVNVVNNNYSYSRYLYLGGSITLPDAKYSNIGVYGAFSRTFFGVSYMPYQKGLMLTGGYRVLKLK
jgi:hypothetical protein